MDQKRDLEELEKVFAAGEAWLRKYGIVTAVAHNSIVANLYVNFPKVKYLEYFLPQDSSRRKVWVTLYVPFWSLVLSNRDRMIDDVVAFLREYLYDYDIKVQLKRYRKGVEKSNEVPPSAMEHVAVPDVELQSGSPDRSEAGSSAGSPPEEGEPDKEGDPAPGAQPDVGEVPSDSGSS